jgi:hypothetical protein
MHSQPFPSVSLAFLNPETPNGTMALWHFIMIVGEREQEISKSKSIEFDAYRNQTG